MQAFYSLYFHSTRKKLNFITKNILSEVIKNRQPNTHKYNYGSVLIVGGNKNYGGAIIMSAQAAVNSGAGLVTVACDPINLSSLHSVLPEAVFQDFNDLKSLKSMILKSNVISVGSGLGTTKNSLRILKAIFEVIGNKQVLIIDGSAFEILHENTLLLPDVPIILTPHQGEWEKYSGLPVAQQIEKNNKKIISELGKIPPILVLKKHRTEIYYEDEVWQNQSGNAGMATAGMGDTLAGMIAGFCAQFPDLLEATKAAVFLHGFIGDELAKKRYVITPSEIVNQIPLEMKFYSNS